MIQHIHMLTHNFEGTWIMRSHTRPAAQRPCVYGARKTPQEVEEARLRRAPTGSLNTGLMPAADTNTMAKGGSRGTFAKDLFPVMWDGRVPQTPYTTVTRRLQATAHCVLAPSQGTGTYAQHTHHRVLRAVGCTELQKHAALWDTTRQGTWLACPCSNGALSTTCRHARGAWSLGEACATAVARVTTK